MSTARSIIIGVKRMGEIDSKPLEVACRSRFPPDAASVKAAEICSLWQDVYMKDPDWHPFKQVAVEGETDVC